MDAAETGRKGEAVAARYYQQRGCLLLAHDYRTRMGEMDLDPAGAGRDHRAV